MIFFVIEYLLFAYRAIFTKKFLLFLIHKILICDQRNLSLTLFSFLFLYDGINLKSALIDIKLEKHVKYKNNL